MSQPEAKELYKLRGQTVELGFADAKGNRRFDRYHGRGFHAHERRLVYSSLLKTCSARIGSNATQ